MGPRQREVTGTEAVHLAAYHQLAYAAYPGIVARLRYDFWDPDREVKDDQLHRPGLGLDLALLPWLSLNSDVRIGIQGDGAAAADLFMQLHAFF